MTDNEFFAVRLSELRRSARLTQEQLAKRLNISRSCLANYESCRRYPNFSILQSVSEFFNVSINYLVGKEDIVIQNGKIDLQEAEFRKFVAGTSSLDLTGISPVRKIAIIEYYKYLLERNG